MQAVEGFVIVMIVNLAGGVGWGCSDSALFNAIKQSGSVQSMVSAEEARKTHEEWTKLIRHQLMTSLIWTDPSLLEFIPFFGESFHLLGLPQLFVPWGYVDPLMNPPRWDQEMLRTRNKDHHSAKIELITWRNCESASFRDENENKRSQPLCH